MTDLLLPDVETDAAASRRPMIVVDDAHVTYRVFASGKRMTARDSLLSINALRGGRGLQTVPALRGVSFTASEGETIGVIGHNGSGKSTLFRAISGLIPTSQGTIWAADRPVLLGVNAALVPELSGENNIKLGLLAMGFTQEEAAARVDEIADFAELNEFLYHPMRTYSSGMGARLRFAIASAKAHSVLLIDEALSVGDRRFKVKSEERIRALRDSAGVVMIVSHSVSSLRDTCERVLWIHKGELRADGSASGVINDYVKWTKQPGSSAVGAAATAKTQKPAPKKAAAKAVVGEPISTAAAPKAESDAAVTAITAVLAPSAHADAGGALAVAAPVSHESARDIARRERYRRMAHEKSRRRIITVSITAGAILLAVGAGAAIALLSGVPQTAPAVRAIEAPMPSVSITSVVPPPAGIIGFTSDAAVARCSTAGGDTPVTLNWEVANASRVSLAVGAAEVDAIAEPLQADLPLVGSQHIVSYPCAEAARTYTLTAEGADGARTSSTIVVNREIAPRRDDTPDPVPSPAPAEPAPPAPAPDPETTPDPTPSPEVTPTPEVPAPETPAPEPTEVVPGAEQPAETGSP